MKIRFASLAAVGTLACVAVAPAWAGGPPNGVYECYGRPNITGPRFGITGSDSYTGGSGATGHYSYDETTLILTMVDGPQAGITYKKEDDAFTFRLLDKGEMTTFSCPRNTVKDPAHPPW